MLKILFNEYFFLCRMIIVIDIDKVNLSFE